MLPSASSTPATSSAASGLTAGRLAGAPADLVIWTTTPWTLPANQAVAVRDEFRYVLVEAERAGERLRLILAADLLDSCLERYGMTRLEVLAEASGPRSRGPEAAAPVPGRQVPVILGEHVTLDAGTGAVHTAPAHGQEDFAVGQRYDLPVANPVGNDGRFLPDTPLVAGLKVEEANGVLIDALRARGRLVHHEPFVHSYPHCWRHKTPVIFRTTPQWFISMERKGLRQHALRDIRKVQWTPDWGEQRITGMIENRPDWCISRQRTWGVPHSAVRARADGRAASAHARADRAGGGACRADGVEAWFSLDPAELLGAEADQYEKVKDVMDVWADSGAVVRCVGAERPEIAAPVDLYLEGSDQHRGWFHSSLLMSEALYERAPYRGVLTHGFTVDEKGRKQSKSLGNVVAPQKVMSTLGADVLRLWVSATDYANEMSVSDEILKRMADSYRRMRNTVRYLLGNLHGFDPKRDAVAPGELLALDRWALARTAALQAEIIEAYRRYAFHLIYQKVHNFCSVDLGGFYLDVLKDRMYTTPTAGPARRSAQTVMHHIAECMVRWLAPILSFTAEEIWQFLPGERSESVFLETWYQAPDVAATISNGRPCCSCAAMSRANSRSCAMQAPSARRSMPRSMSIARRTSTRASALWEKSCASSSSRPMLAFIGLEGAPPADAVPATNTGRSGVWIAVKPTSDPKCVRCWQRRPDVGVGPEASRDLRSLRDQCRGPGRSAPVRMSTGISRPIQDGVATRPPSGLPWLPVTIAGDLSRPDGQALDRRSPGPLRHGAPPAGARYHLDVQYGRSLQLPLRGPRAGRGGCSRAWRWWWLPA